MERAVTQKQVDIAEIAELTGQDRKDLGLLVLQRDEETGFWIGNIRVVVQSARSGIARLIIVAPKSMVITRNERPGYQKRST